MVDDPLISASDLTGFRGAPFVQAVADAAAGAVRAECGWHIAPEVNETARVRGGSRILLLPTLKLTGVTSITDTDGNAVTGWEWFESGVVELDFGSFPRVVIVSFRHGYPACPAELLPVIAERAVAQSSGRIRSESAGGVSVSMETGDDPTGTSTLARYRIPGRL
jgi:hypothetical protein